MSIMSITLKYITNSKSQACIVSYLPRGVYSSIIPPPPKKGGGERNQRLLGLGKKIKE